MKHLIGKILLALSPFTTAFAQAEIVATVDRNIISNADLLTLTVRASNNTSGIEPDFSVLDADFEVVSVSPQRSNSFSIINGNTTSTSFVDYVIRLAPKRMGELIIPPIKAGTQVTRAIPISVQRLSSAQQNRMDQFVFFETMVDNDEVYVQQQVIYTVKLFYTDAIGGDFPQAPVLPETVVEILENEKRYETIVNGRRYYVLEKRYAIFPQRSGELVIPRERFNGQRGRGSIFARKQSVSAISESHTVIVNTIPATFQGKDWVPAKGLALSETWTGTSSTIRVGEPINRSIKLSVEGLSSNTVPPIEEFAANNAKVYADPPTNENQVKEHGIEGIQTTTIGIVPTEPGELVLPEVQYPWWNVETNQQEVAVLPAVTFQVLASLVPVENIPVAAAPVTDLTNTLVGTTGIKPFWQWGAIIAGMLCLLLTWQLLNLKRKIKILESATSSRDPEITYKNPDEQREYRALRAACRSSNAADAHHQLFLWAKARFPEISATSQLGYRHRALAVELENLEAHLFSGRETTTWRGDNLLSSVDALRSKKSNRALGQSLMGKLNPI